jgi:hypothetical protein
MELKNILLLIFDEQKKGRDQRLADLLLICEPFFN